INGDVVQAGMSIYRHLLSGPDAGIAKEDIAERLAYFCFCAKNWSESRSLLERGGEPRTAEGRFCLAVMLKSGHGGRIRKADGIRMIRQAEAMDGFFAQAAAVVKQRWMAEDLSNL
ncbi:MAG: hypothetical protein Q4F72_08280, partial [Desulfovibrionaceae bacterium]|nr:hypothetical protein [Desulfovibrionaceae bacterium]